MFLLMRMTMAKKTTMAVNSYRPKKGWKLGVDEKTLLSVNEITRGNAKTESNGSADKEILIKKISSLVFGVIWSNYECTGRNQIIFCNRRIVFPCLVKMVGGKIPDLISFSEATMLRLSLTLQAIMILSSCQVNVGNNDDNQYPSKPCHLTSQKRALCSSLTYLLHKYSLVATTLKVERFGRSSRLVLGCQRP